MKPPSTAASLLQPGAHGSGDFDTAIRVVRGVVAGQRAGVRTLVVGDGRAPVRGNHVGIEADQALPGRIGTAASDTVRAVAGRATEPGIDVERVLGKTRVLHDVGEVVAFRAHRIRPIRAEVGIREQVRDRPARPRRLAELITAFKDVLPLRSMRTDGASASEFAAVVAAVAIGAEDLRTHGTALCSAIQV